MGITLFLAHKKIFQNKLSEIVNNKLKMLVVLIVLRKDTQGLCALNKTQPSQFKHKSNTTK
jgi:predicted glutamine amidotransferase